MPTTRQAYDTAGDRELRAAAILSHSWNTLVGVHDDGTQPSMADLLVEFDEGSMHIEVTSSLSTVRTSAERQIQRRGISVEIAGPPRRYWVQISPSADIRRLRQQLPALLRRAESLGVPEVYQGVVTGSASQDHDDHRTLAMELMELGVVSAFRTSFGKDGADLDLHNEVVTFRGDINVLVDWCAQFLAERSADVAKAASGRLPGHLFVWTNRDHESEFVFAFQDLRHGLPTRHLRMPPDVCGLWIATEEGPYANVRYTTESGWEAFEGSLHGAYVPTVLVETSEEAVTRRWIDARGEP